MSGSPLAIAILGVESLQASLTFYRDLIGLDAGEVVPWRGPAFAAHWRLPPGSSARAVLLGFPGSDVGRILLLEFAAAGRRRVRESAERRFFGLFNLNFYTRDIRGAAAGLSARGFRLWSEPVQYEMSASVGRPIEMVFEGPDAVPINLVELTGGEEGTRVGDMRRFLERHGTTRAGYTEVVTSAHCVRDREAALRFHERVLGQEVLIDEVMDKAESNHFLNLPRDARTRVTFMKGSHLFGKVVLTHPLNYAIPDLVPVAVPPNVGYLAMSFVVEDLESAAAAAKATGAETLSPAQALEIPGLGQRRVLLLRHPGSGALTQLLEAA